jgi:transposase
MTKQWTRLTDSQWNEVKPYLPTGRKRKHDLRDIVDAILWMVRTGVQWRNLPDQFPPYRSVFYYFNKWSKSVSKIMKI